MQRQFWLLSHVDWASDPAIGHWLWSVLGQAQGTGVHLGRFWEPQECLTSSSCRLRRMHPEPNREPMGHAQNRVPSEEKVLRIAREAKTLFMLAHYFLQEPLSSGKGGGKLSTAPQSLCESECTSDGDGQWGNGRVARHLEELQAMPNQLHQSASSLHVHCPKCHTLKIPLKCSPAVKLRASYCGLPDSPGPTLP